MKHLSWCETFRTLLVGMLIANLILMPVVPTSSAAQMTDEEPPFISHQPEKVGIRGKALPIIAYIADESQLQKVTLTITVAGQSVTGALPKLKTAGPVPVLVQALKDADVLEKPKKKARKVGKVLSGEAMNVTEVSGAFYRVHTPIGLTGFVPAEACEVIATGTAHGVSIPAKLTKGDSLFYQISATDVYNNTATTGLIKVKLLSDDELMALKAAKSKHSGFSVKRSGPTPLFAKVAFIAGVALVGGGAYLMYRSNASKTTKANITITTTP